MFQQKPLSAGWLVVKHCLTLFLFILVPTYWHYYGPQNFLWFSDIGLFLTVAALWLRMPLLMSMAAVGMMVLELSWWLDFSVDVVCNSGFCSLNIMQLSDYMFNRALPLWLRAISLFHVVTPVIWLVYLVQYGYQRRALYAMTVLCWAVLCTTYFLTPPAENINWVFLPQLKHWHMAPWMWLIMLLIGFPLLLFLPTHWIYMHLFAAPASKFHEIRRGTRLDQDKIAG